MSWSSLKMYVNNLNVGIDDVTSYNCRTCSNAESEYLQSSQSCRSMDPGGFHFTCGLEAYVYVCAQTHTRQIAMYIQTYVVFYIYVLQIN